MGEEQGRLHIVMLPWLAMGHLLPFFELSRHVARKGHRISFLTTRDSIQRLKIPADLSHLLHPVELSLARMDNLPDSIGNTVDLTSDEHRQYLRIAFHSLEAQLSDFLQRCHDGPDPPPDWIIYDYPAHWVPDVAAAYGVRCAYFSIFNAATLSFFGSPSDDRPSKRTAPEHFTTVPEWITFPSTVAFRPHEARQICKAGAMPSPDNDRFTRGILASPFIAIRSCTEFEPEWLELLTKLYHPIDVVPVGVLPPPPPAAEADQEAAEEWASSSTCKWLDKQEPGSVVYAAFGSETALTSAQLDAVALGLELCGLPFVLALRKELPEGFEGGTRGRGVVCKGWIPQVRLLAHPSIGGFLTHGGWSSIAEALSLGVALVILTMGYDQGLTARSMVDKGVGLEVPREEEDGEEDGSGFTGEAIAKCLRLVMVEEEGEKFRAKARECKEILGNDKLQDKYSQHFLNYLWNHRHHAAPPTSS